MRRVILSMVFLLAATCFVEAAQITRGPYLQKTTQTSTVLRWRTDANAGSVVNYGTAPTRLTKTAEGTDGRTEHTVEITGLEPGKRYYYAIMDGENQLAGGDEDHYVETHPPEGFRGATRVWVLGDCGTGNPDAMAVRNAFMTYSKDQKADFTIVLGDNAYGSGTDHEYQNKFFNIYQKQMRNLTFWSTRGNHEKDANAYYNAFVMPTRAEAGGTPSLSEAYYSFDYANIHFVCLDSYMSDRSESGPMLTWLKVDLNNTLQEWIVCYFHHPPYSKGSHDTDDLFDSEGRLFDMREQANPILEAHGVDLVLNGHSHSYERSRFVQGHYGVSQTFDAAKHVVQEGSGRPEDGGYQDEGRGTVYLVGGSSGKKSGGALNHPVMFYSENSLGSVVIDVKGHALKATFLTNQGKTTDTFVIKH